MTDLAAILLPGALSFAGFIVVWHLARQSWRRVFPAGRSGF